MVRKFVAMMAAVGLMSLAPKAADAAVTVVRSQFAAATDRGRPTGDAAVMASTRRLAYWMTVSNDGPPAQITIVWKVDGVEERRRQTDSIGKSPTWRTWFYHRVNRGNHTYEIEILDASGASLKKDTITINAT